MKHAYKLFVVAAWLALLTGCGFKDIDKRFFVVTIGLDVAEGKDPSMIRLTLKLAIPKGDPKSGEDKFQLFTQESKTITEAIAMIRSRIDKELDFGHTKTVIFSEALVKRDMTKELDWILRQRNLQGIAWLGIGRPTAKAVLSVSPPSERYPSNALLLAFGNTGTESQRIVSRYLYAFFRDLEEPGVNSILPIIEAEKDHFEINKAGVFNKQNRLALVLMPQETRLINFFSKKEQDMILYVDRGKESFSVDTRHLEIHYKVLDDGEGGVRIPVTLTANGVVEEVADHEELDQQRLEYLERETEEELKNQLSALLVKLQKNRLDPVGFGLRYRASRWDSHDKEVRDWARLYPEATFEVSAKIHIEDTGYTR